MGFYLDICNKSIEFKKFDSLSENEHVKSIHNKTKIENPNYNEVDKIFKDYISHFNKIFDLYLVKCEFEVNFINSNFVDFLKTEYFFNTSLVIMKNYLIYHLYRTIPDVFNFSHIHKMKVKSISNFSYMNQPIKMIEQRINMNIAKHRQLIISLNRGNDHPLIKNYKDIPYNI